MTTVGTRATVQVPRRWSVSMWVTTGVAAVAIAVTLVVDATHIDLLGWVVAVVMLLACGVSWMILAPIGCARYREYRTVVVAPVVVIVGLGLVWFGVDVSSLSMTWRLSAVWPTFRRELRRRITAVRDISPSIRPMTGIGTDSR
ncbi:hypothetical protein [Nocardia salmonicida]|uniref:hypothetical protein n=1 Tax=Nocardia salmonicida TaxID=53431 RepID=UPI0037A153FA